MEYGQSFETGRQSFCSYEFRRSELNVASEQRCGLEKPKTMGKKVCFFGHFGTDNLGNESTLQAVLYHLCRRLPDAEVSCVCSVPETLASTQGLKTIAISKMIVRPWNTRSPVAKLLRKAFIGIPSELYRWLDAYRTLRGTDVFIIPGTGLLTDAYGLSRWGPYNLFKWSALDKLRRCKLLFVSVGAGPLYSVLGRYLVKSALALADFRSYRDNSSRECVRRINLRADNDQVYPDLAFSLPVAGIPRDEGRRASRCVVGLGLMEYAERYSIDRPSRATYLQYLESLVAFVKWLLAHECEIKLLIGDRGDRPVVRELNALLTTRLGMYDRERITEPPLFSVEQLLSQLAVTDIVVATRFHNVLLALLLNKPTISISFHHKCVSLMSEMGLLEYSHDINQIDAAKLIEQFQSLERNAETLKPLISQKVEQFRKALDEQYSLIFKSV